MNHQPWSKRPEFVELDSIGSGMDYDWDLVALLENTNTGELFLYTDGGCSCNGPYEYAPEDSNLEPIDSREKLAQFKGSFTGQTFYGHNENDISDFVQSVEKHFFEREKVRAAN